MNQTNKTNLLKFGKTASKVIEIICWVGAAIILMTAVASIFNIEWTVQNLMPETSITMNGFEINVNDPDSSATFGALLTALFGGVIGIAVMALIFRNMYNVLKTAESGSPFQPENVKRIETIGWMSIAMPVIAFVTSVLVKLLGGPDALEVSFSLSGVIMGVLVLILSQFFARGVELENDVDGLV
ncbi:MAG: DUF2975 domain-containing protein [Clostridiales bacterium]|nr:DUF2975 domain-containing protein [Clostridiales bacterium]